jgi:addiction module HigA family antidote
MSIPNTRPLERRPIHPGEILREDFMPDYGLSVSGLAAALGVSRQSVNELVRERRALSPEMALRLGRPLRRPDRSGRGGGADQAPAGRLSRGPCRWYAEGYANSVDSRVAAP